MRLGGTSDFLWAAVVGLDDVAAVVGLVGLPLLNVAALAPGLDFLGTAPEVCFVTTPGLPFAAAP